MTGLLVCVIRLTAPDDPQTKITLIRTDVSKFTDEEINLEEFDQSLWEMAKLILGEDGLENQLVFISKTYIQVSGEVAIRRIFYQPLVENHEGVGTEYVFRLLVVDRRKIYHLYLTTQDSVGFKQYQELMDQIIFTISFW